MPDITLLHLVFINLAFAWILAEIFLLLDAWQEPYMTGDEFYLRNFVGSFLILSVIDMFVWSVVMEYQAWLSL